jgi:predicted adenine nucleotide alpha hydrolase (AANH) superfamily ATPase
MKLLMHMCCSNCSILPLQTFLLKDIGIKGLWFNPNIHPFTEYSKRLGSLMKLQKIWGLDIEYLDDYPLDDFLSAVVRQEANRCSVCYSLRLEKTAAVAKEMGLDGFTTSLLASPYQKFDMIIAIGQKIGKRESVPFFFEDLRQGWKSSKALSIELELYRQRYCGCIYSEMERFRQGKKNPPGPQPGTISGSDRSRH